MEHVSLGEVVDELLADAHRAPAGRAARTVHGGHEHALRQTLIALTEGHGLDEHESPGEATLHVIEGRVRLSNNEASWEGSPGDHLVIPRTRHRLDALADSAVLLTVVKPVGPHV